MAQRKADKMMVVSSKPNNFEATVSATRCTVRLHAPNCAAVSYLLRFMNICEKYICVNKILRNLTTHIENYIRHFPEERFTVEVMRNEILLVCVAPIIKPKDRMRHILLTYKAICKKKPVLFK
jgi:hypothetical protein